jgi:5-methylcytosine-specific restriction enzyme subunit McrC
VERTVFPCKEFEPVHVPLEHLLVNGKIEVYPAAEKYFDLDYRERRVVVVPKSYVGLIPVNDRVAIHVTPRFSIANLFHILQKSSAHLRFIEGFRRTYMVTDERRADPIALLAEQVTTLAGGLVRTGLLRRYCEVSDEGAAGGVLDVSATLHRFRSRGIRHRHVWRRTEHSVQIPENELIKAALQRVFAYVTTVGRRDRARLRTLREALFVFDQVTIPPGLFVDEVILARMVARLPAQYQQPYAALLWLAYLLHAHKGVAIETSGTASFDTFVVNLADVFEDYVRNLVRASAHELPGIAYVVDGNVNQVPLFVQGADHKVKPDIYLKTQRGATLAVLDAKYKPQIKASDRYEVLAFCEALQARLAVVLCPGDSERDPELLGTTPGGVRLFLLKINLDSQDMAAAESLFIRRVASLLPAA